MFNEILIKIRIFCLTKMQLKLPPVKCRPFCRHFNILKSRDDGWPVCQCTVRQRGITWTNVNTDLYRHRTSFPKCRDISRNLVDELKLEIVDQWSTRIPPLPRGGWQWVDCNWTFFKITRQPFWKPHSWQSLGFCLQPQRTCTWNLKLKFQSKLVLRCRNQAI